MPMQALLSYNVDYKLATNNPDFLDKTEIRSFFTSFAEGNIKVSPQIFGSLFEAWKNHNTVEISYETPAKELSVRKIDPYIITFYKGTWYTKAWCHLRNSIRLFAVHRIKQITLTELTFEVDESVITNFNENNPFDFKFENVENIELLFSKEIANSFFPFLRNHWQISFFANSFNYIIIIHIFVSFRVFISSVLNH